VASTAATEDARSAQHPRTCNHALCTHDPGAREVGMSHRSKTFAVAVVGALVAVVLVVATPASAAPENDTYAGATTITGAVSVEVTSNVGATIESGESDKSAFNVEHTIWFRWVAPSSGQAVADTEGSSIDTELAVFVDGPGGTLAAATRLDANDDDGEGMAGRVQFDVQAGTTYRFQVDGVSNATGNVELNLNLPEFSDVGYGYAFFGDVDWVASRGIAGGYLDGTYRPSAVISRAAMSAFLMRLVEAENTFPPPPTFTDVPFTHPFYDEIEFMNFRHITTGYPDHTFRPAGSVTRQSMSAFLYRLEGSPPPDNPATPSFSDVSTTHPFYDEIEWMNGRGITMGYPDGTFRPSDAVRRGPMAAFLHRLYDTGH
jgi:hypothetical protein